MFHKKVQSMAMLCAAFSAGAVADTVMVNNVSAVAPLGSSPTVIDLSGIAQPSQAPVIGSGYSIAFSGVAANQGVVQGTNWEINADPIANTLPGDAYEYLTGGFASSLTDNIATAGNYLSTGQGTITLTFTTPQNSLALLWGSGDPGNSLHFNDASSYTVTGGEIEAATGNYQFPNTFVVIDTSTPFTTVTATSSEASFEFDGVAASATPFTFTPEPASLPLLSAGVALLACAMWIRRKLAAFH